MLKKKLIAVMAMMFITTGCASIMSGKTQSVSIASDPPGAKISVNGMPFGVTPIMVNIPRKNANIQVSKKGFNTVMVPLQTGMNPWFMVDIVLISPLSTSIDTSTGAINEYSPGQYMINLQPEE